MDETNLKDRILVFRTQYAWTHNFEDREIAEILWALEYGFNYGHGTSGHLGYNVIKKMFGALTEKP